METPPKAAGPQSAVPIAQIAATNPDNVRSVYTNNISFVATNWDVRMLCMEVVGGVDGKPEQFLRANVVMSIDHAEALLVALENTLKGIRESKKPSEPAK